MVPEKKKKCLVRNDTGVREHGIQLFISMLVLACRDIQNRQCHFGDADDETADDQTSRA